MVQNFKPRNSGNIFLAIFGAVAVVGVLSASVATFMKGPIQGSIKLAQQSRAETQIVLAGQAAIMAAMNLGNTADCDADGMVEPLEWRIGAPAPVGGGLIPMSIGIAKKDPWGTEYGYCVWDHGPALLNAACQTTSGTNKRLEGYNSSNYPVIAIVSAGPDKVFSTTCRNFSTGATRADQNNNGVLTDAGDLPLISKASVNDDDLIFTRNYTQASALSGGLWSLKAGDPTKATIAKDLEIAGNAKFSGTGAFQRLAASSNEYLETLNGLKISGPSIVAACNSTNKGTLRADAAGTGLEICSGTAWSPIATDAVAAPAPKPIGGEYRVFVTSTTYTSNLGGLAGADAKCQTAADNAGLTGTYKAWLSDSTGSPSTRFFKADGPYKLMDGTVIANNWADLIDGTIGTNIKTLTNTNISGEAFTATTASGTLNGTHCGNWTSGTGTAFAGNTISATSTWTAKTSASGCSGSANLYCFAQSSTIASAPPTTAHFTNLSSAENPTVCGLKSDESIWCWGQNNFGQLGDDTTTNRNIPTKVFGTDTWSQIEVGREYNCGLKSDGSAWCWGLNDDGQLGNNSQTSSSRPVPVSGGGTWKNISAGYKNTCGVKSNGIGYCWGGWGNAIGRPSVYDVTLVPTAISGGGTWKTISMGSLHACGIKSDDSIWCWGDSYSGSALGIGNTSGSAVPVKIVEEGPWSALSVGDSHVCAIKQADKSLWCWGNNTSGRLGDNSTTTRSAPVPIAVGSTWSQIAVSAYSCGVKIGGAAFCWGGNYNGGIGDGTTADRSVPTAVSGTGPWLQVVPANGSACAIKANNTTSCWGYNYNGSLGNGSNVSSLTPTPIYENLTVDARFPLKAPDGTVVAPSYSFANSASSGMWFAGGAVKLNSAAGLDMSASEINFTGSTTDFRLASSGGVKISNDTGSCTSSIAGTMRYNSTSKKIEFCNGGSWKGLVRPAPQIAACVPGAINFVDQVDVNFNDDIISNTVTVSGLTAPCYLFADFQFGGSFILDGKDLQAPYAFVSNGNKIALKAKSNSAPGGAALAKLYSGMGVELDQWILTSTTCPGGAGKQSYTEPGTYSFTAPAGTNSCKFVLTVKGAGGGGYNYPGGFGGNGGGINFSFTPGNNQIFDILVGGRGASKDSPSNAGGYGGGGGGASSGGNYTASGGGASAVKYDGTVLVIAGGGGGSQTSSAGGAGGPRLPGVTLSGADGIDSFGRQGRGGNNNVGGAGGVYNTYSGGTGGSSASNGGNGTGLTNGGTAFPDFLVSGGGGGSTYSAVGQMGAGGGGGYGGGGGGSRSATGGGGGGYFKTGAPYAPLAGYSVVTGGVGGGGDNSATALSDNGSVVIEWK